MECNEKIFLSHKMLFRVQKALLYCEGSSTNHIGIYTANMKNSESMRGKSVVGTLREIQNSFILNGNVR